MNLSFKDARKVLYTDDDYTEPGNALGHIAYIERSELCELIGSTKENRLLTDFKNWLAENYGEILQPFYPGTASANGYWILSKTGDKKQRAADTKAALARNAGEMKTHRTQNKLVFGNTQIASFTSLLAMQARSNLRHMMEICREEGLEFTREETQALLQSLMEEAVES